MLIEQSLNLIQIDPAARRPIKKIDTNVDIQHPSYVDYLHGKYIVTRDFNRRYPEYPIEIIEPHDQQSIVIVSDHSRDLPVGVIRVCLDSQQALPITPYVMEEYRTLKNKGLKLAEVGRMFVEPHNADTYKLFMASVYSLAMDLNIDCYLIQIRTERVGMYESLFGAIPISETRSCDGCTHMAWHIENTPPVFLRRFPVHAVEVAQTRREVS